MRPYIAAASRILRPGLVLGCLGALLLGSCETTKTTAPAPSVPLVLHAAQPNQAWMVRAGGRTVGALVRFEEPGSDRYLYSVRDGHGLDRGIVDAEGRAWRFRPHEEPEWASTGTVASGIAAVLQLAATPSLAEVDLGEVPALLEASLRR
ncbi:MAG: hypothetical protein ACI8QC_004194 [Planctomycetota bacterium]|jgi:hypothetical protein